MESAGRIGLAGCFSETPMPDACTRTNAYILALEEAYAQLDWGTDTVEMSAAAAALEALAPGHDILMALLQRIRRARAISAQWGQAGRCLASAPDRLCRAAELGKPLIDRNDGAPKKVDSDERRGEGSSGEPTGARFTRSDEGGVM